MIQFLEKFKVHETLWCRRYFWVIRKPLFKDILLQKRLIKDKLKKLAIMLCVTNNDK